MDPEVARVFGLLSGAITLLEKVRYELLSLGLQDAEIPVGTTLMYAQELQERLLRRGEKK